MLFEKEKETDVFWGVLWSNEVFLRYGNLVCRLLAKMGFAPGDIQARPWSVGKSKGKKKKDSEEGAGCWIKFRFLGSCWSRRDKGERSITSTSTPYGI